MVTQKTIRAILEERVENYRKYGSLTTVNAYFNFMAGAGYIRRSPQNRVWVVVKPVPSDLTASKLKVQYNNRSQRRGYSYGSLQDRNSSRKLF